nr:metallophosphoesterase [Clostridia bacterium]
MSKTTVLRTVVFVLVLSLLVSAVPLYADILINSRPNEISTGLSFDSMPNGSNVIITAGKDDSRRHLTWDSYSESEEYVEWIEADKLIDGALPAGCYRNTATKYGAICRAEITDMVSGARYAYRVGSDLAGWSDIYYINANDMQDESFSFILVGDPQINTNVDGENWNITLEKARSWFGDDIEFIISAGDQVNAGESESEYDQFISPDYLRSTPLITIVGNHDDRASNYSSHFTYTDVDQSTVSTAGKYSGDYWVEYDGTLIMSLNVQNESIALHRSFMEKAVAEYTEAHGEPAWTMVSFHDSLFSGAASRYQEEWENRDIYSSIFSELGVDAVMLGHDHIYTRTYMINDTEIINDADLYTQIGDDPYASIHNPEDGDVVFITANSSSGSKFYEITDKPLPFAACANQE